MKSMTKTSFPVTVTAKYTNGSTVRKVFNNSMALNRWMHNEGDHLVEVIFNPDE